jgi:hypothetical protein
MGEDGDWFRIRLQEEVYHHGLEGDVLKAADRAFVVVLEGDKSVIKRMHSDVREMCPTGIQCTELIFSIPHGRKSAAIRRPGHVGEQEYMLDVLSELERKITRIDQNVNRILALLEGGARPANPNEEAAAPAMEVREEAASGFASMFGN